MLLNIVVITCVDIIGPVRCVGGRCYWGDRVLLSSSDIYDSSERVCKNDYVLIGWVDKVGWIYDLIDGDLKRDCVCCKIKDS